MRVNLAASLCIYRFAKNMIIIATSEKIVDIVGRTANRRTEINDSLFLISHAYRPIWTEHVFSCDRFCARVLISHDTLSTLRISSGYTFLKETKRN